ncbi:tRNA preQ1(34) S-adenosylmethionine ribosyltransferase-isomerase QueA [Leptothoe spongobia]|uniref:S-adenosylmethionine:tRNA ribosyltransferase-isomerase n=1 Tax=Leptothoe spongobia TAU-MAC 1115 TaxID=1967444 RepID=A0A947GI93_9CYAN|nr:tRNA preQ1(34) S-adenosylmethionine ribosyltransferase-isomerase QueA [Leptothoe spongobia]MBT9315088.1 tRNA preQ1(34) S-adenosylmethionine ribosyltransferase-isomerase QueA [Leptothoe spongobia TAU-MAC 1115]
MPLSNSRPPHSTNSSTAQHQANNDYSLTAYQYDLPTQLIAQEPAIPRDHSRLMVVSSRTEHQHVHFKDLPRFLCPGDLLIINNTRVIPARMYGYKPSGAKVEVLLLEPRPPQWLALVKPGRRLKPGSCIHFGSDIDHPVLKAHVEACDLNTNGRLLSFESMTDTPVDQLMESLGEVPLPPYITDSQADPNQYQTIYAQHPGAVAAPTAGLHFTPEVFQALEEKGIQRAEVTLHVGLGTFRPVESKEITQHQMHAEWVDLPQTTVDLIRETKDRGNRVFAVGTTTVRTLEGVATQEGQLKAYQGPVNLFIYPGYQWKVVDGLITNFHLPGSSLLMLVSGLIGRQRLMELYQEAIKQTYRFYSFGDAMVILPDAYQHIQGTQP